MNRDEELDDQFKKGLNDPVNETAYREKDWKAMEQLLDKGKKPAVIVFWLPILSSVAAILILVAGGWFLFKPENFKPRQHPQQEVKLHLNKINHKVDTGTSGGTIQQNRDIKNIPALQYTLTNGTSHHEVKRKSFITDKLSADGDRRVTTGTLVKTLNNKKYASLIKVTNPEKKDNTQVTINASTIMLNRSSVDTAGIKIAVKTPPDTMDNNIAGAPVQPLQSHKIKVTGGERQRPQFALGVIASSDLNGVNSLGQSELGSNYGVVFTAGISKWSITTGAAYSIKPYVTGYDNYHTAYQFKTPPNSVSANCRMLDIPLNVNYQVYRKQRNKISVGTGLSSYIILREDYRFNYDPSTGATGPTVYSVINKNRNYFGIVNLNATYQHQVNSKVGVLVQPYLKLPLSNVGASQVRLQTAGVAVGLNWNLNTLTKP